MPGKKNNDQMRPSYGKNKSGKKKRTLRPRRKNVKNENGESPSGKDRERNIEKKFTSGQYRRKKTGQKSFGRREERKSEPEKKYRGGKRSGRYTAGITGRKQGRKKSGRTRKTAEARPVTGDETMRLNKYIAHTGLCSRRDADQLISDGKVRVNGAVITELGTRVRVSDKIEVEGHEIEPEPFVYLLMHKPRNVITTTSDEKGRRTVIDLVEETTGKRVYPVGRLDRNTTGLLLLTNDGELANRLMHPAYRIGKIYEVTADRPFNEPELNQFRKGVALDDGMASAYFIQRDLVNPRVFQVGVQEGRNHLVRRMVEALGGEVRKLKRVNYAGLTLKGLRPGRWRSLFPDEINKLREMVKLKPLKIIRRNG